MDWRDNAACTAEDPELFFPIGDGTPAAAQVAQAKAVCHRCPVMRECRDWSLAAGVDGVWGGLDATDRRKLRRASVTRAA